MDWSAFASGASGVLGSLISGAFGYNANAETNATNKSIADENLEYQKERNKIEDARYNNELVYNRQFAESERNYNRAFLEENREYERALQQEIFNREDTAIERQASQLSALGINPLSQQMSGLGAGQAVSSPSPTSTPAPSAPSSNAQALHNDYQAQNNILDFITPFLSLANGLENLNTNGFQRDILREQADYQRLKNQEQAILNQDLAEKLFIESEQRKEDLRHSKSNNPNVELDTKSSAERNERENAFQEKFGVTDNTNNYVRMASDISHSGERAYNYVDEKIGDVSKSAIKTLGNKALEGLNKYNETMKKADNWLLDKGRKIKNWFKSKSAPAEDALKFAR